MQDNLLVSTLTLSNMVDQVTTSRVSLPIANTVFVQMNVYNIWYAPHNIKCRRGLYIVPFVSFFVVVVALALLHKFPFKWLSFAL